MYKNFQNSKYSIVVPRINPVYVTLVNNNILRKRLLKLITFIISNTYVFPFTLAAVWEGFICIPRYKNPI